MADTHEMNEAELKARISEVKAEQEAEVTAASEARTSEPGWPVMVVDGSEAREVLAVKAIGQVNGRTHVLDADGNEYAPISGNPTNGYVLAGSDLSEEELADVEANGTVPSDEGAAESEES